MIFPSDTKYVRIEPEHWAAGTADCLLSKTGSNTFLEHSQPMYSKPMVLVAADGDDDAGGSIL